MLAQVIIIENDGDYRAARERLESLMDAEEPEEVALLRAQAMLIAAWEERQAPAMPPDPTDAARFRMDQMGLTPASSSRSRRTPRGRRRSGHGI